MTKTSQNALGEDFSAEDDPQAQVSFENAATGELERLKANLRYLDRRTKILFKRSIGRQERQRLKQKYNS